MERLDELMIRAGNGSETAKKKIAEIERANREWYQKNKNNLFKRKE